MKEITTPEEYRKKVSKQKTIILPSGLKCVIQGMPALQLFQFMTDSKDSDLKLEDYIRKNMVEVLLKVVPSSVVSPTILAPTDGERRTDALYMSELSAGDLVILLNEVVAISGLDEEKLKSFEKFPEQRAGNGVSPDGKGVQL